jgi:hypothetical protein
MMTGIYALIGIYAVAMFVAQVVGSNNKEKDQRRRAFSLANSEAARTRFPINLNGLAIERKNAKV